MPFGTLGLDSLSLETIKHINKQYNMSKIKKNTGDKMKYIDIYKKY